MLLNDNINYGIVSKLEIPVSWQQQHTKNGQLAEYLGVDFAKKCIELKSQTPTLIERIWGLSYGGICFHWEKLQALKQDCN